MHGRRSLNLELTPLDPDLERNIRRGRRAQVKMGDNQRNPRVQAPRMIKGIQEGRSMRIIKMQEMGTGRIEELMTWISQHHSGNCSHLLLSVPIRA
jgi:hypothetical protein